MSVSHDLDTLRDAVPGCVLVAYGDVAAQLVLRSSADRPWPQERLDELCRAGARQFDFAAALRPVMSRPGPEREAILATRRDVRVYVGAPEPAGDMLCCVCRSGTDTGQVLERARATLSQLMDREQ